MIQHSGTLKNFIIYNASKSKNKQITAQPQLVLNLKRGLLYFSKRTGQEKTCLKKINSIFIKQTLFLLKMLLIVFTKLIKQKIVKKIRFLYKNTIKKAQNFSKTTKIFIKNTISIFLPQNNLKQ